MLNINFEKIEICTRNSKLNWILSCESACIYTRIISHPTTMFSSRCIHLPFKCENILLGIFSHFSQLQTLRDLNKGIKAAKSGSLSTWVEQKKKQQHLRSFFMIFLMTSVQVYAWICRYVHAEFPKPKDEAAIGWYKELWDYRRKYMARYVLG